MKKLQSIATLSLAIHILTIAIYQPNTIAGNKTEPVHPLSNVLITTLSKGLEYDGWQSELRLNQALSGEGVFTFNEKVTVNLHHIPGFHRQWKVDQKHSFEYKRPVDSNIELQLTGNLDIFNDQRAHRFNESTRSRLLTPDESHFNDPLLYRRITGSNEISKWHLALGAECHLDERFQINGSAGPLFDKRSGEQNQGLQFNFGLLNNWNTGSLHADGWLERLPVGNDYGWSATIGGDYSFSEEASNIYRISYDRTTQREYHWSDETVGRRKDQVLTIINKLTNTGTTPLHVEWDSDFSRYSTVHTRIPDELTDHEYTWRNELKAVYDLAGIRTVASGGFDLQEQQYKDNLMQGRRNFISVRTGFADPVSDSVAFEANVIKYSFNTPDEDDLNDRDELKYIFTFTAGKELHPNFGLRLKIKTDLHHLVYIQRPRSAENRWVRMFSLSCELPYREVNINNIARFSVVSNYNVYDYFPFDVDMSRVYRFFTADDTFKVKVHPHLELELGTNILIDEHGRFRWSDWIEDVSEDGYNFSLSFATNYTVEDLQFGFGWSTHHHYSWRYSANDDKVRGEAITSNGPIITLNANPANRLHVELYGQVLQVKDRFHRTYNLPDIRCSLTWML
ncbi:MAG: hypothetical protein P9X24_08165 [Candidatus Hatepunaea meridiana]|nr:hypothetical protein [Candidatus Hatepunaea meridiana]